MRERISSLSVNRLHAIHFGRGYETEISPLTERDAECGFIPDKKIRGMAQQGLCHRKFSKCLQNKQSDWSNCTHCPPRLGEIEINFRFRATTLPLLKCWPCLVSLYLVHPTRLLPHSLSPSSLTLPPKCFDPFSYSCDVWNLDALLTTVIETSVPTR